MAARRTLSQAIIVASSLLPLNNFLNDQTNELSNKAGEKMGYLCMTSGLFGLLVSNRSKEGKPSTENLGVERLLLTLRLKDAVAKMKYLTFE